MDQRINPLIQHDVDQHHKFIKSSSLLQLYALIIRFVHRAIRFRISTIFQIFGFPVLLIVLIYFFWSDKNINAAPNPQIVYSISLLFLFNHIITQCNINIIDKETQFKSLMYMMGLNRFIYYIGNLINYMIITLPTLVALLYVFCSRSFEGTPIYETVLIFLLFDLQLGCLIFFFTSPVTSSKFTLILFLLFLLESLYGMGVLHMAKKLKDSNFARLFVFATSISPFQGLRNFADSWIPGGKAQEFRIEVIINEKNIFDPEETHIREVNYAIAGYMLAWSIILFFLAAYLEEIVPWKCDTEIKGPLFCLPSFRRKKKKPQDILESEDQSLLGSLYFEKSPFNRLTGVRLVGLSKSFNSKLAVRNVTMRIFRGETTLLLGHNGSGKTTLMNMLLGQLIPDDGHVEKCQSGTHIGVCPQSSIIDLNLTVEQHLELLMRIKGYKVTNDETFDTLIARTLKDVGLDSHGVKYPGELSGGMLRKLSLGMALVGESDVLVLDEPSSGLDPDSRVFIWNAIRRSRANKTVFLSSQHMEEADYLGDRIAIMSEGRVVCCGSSLFLKRLFGTGYRLRVECRISCIEKALNIVRKYFPKACLFDDDVYAQTDKDLDPIVSVSVRLSQQSATTGDQSIQEQQEEKLIQMLEYIETDNSLIKSHSLRASSIEDVLLNTSRYFKEPSQAQGNLTDQQVVEVAVNTLEMQIDSILSVPQYSSTSKWSQIRTLMMKNFLYHRYEIFSSLNTRLLIPFLALYLSIKDVGAPYEGSYSGYTYSAIVPTAQFSLVISAFSYHPTLERVSKFKSILLGSKASFVTYWLSNLLFDVLTSSVIFLIVINIFLATLVSLEVQGSVIMIHLIASAGAILFLTAGTLIVYLISMIFESTQSSLSKTAFILNANNYVYIILSIAQAMNFPKRIEALDSAQLWFGRLFAALVPSDSFAYILYGLRAEGYYKKDDDRFVEELSPILFGFLALLVQISLYASLLFAIESANISLSSCLNFEYIYKRILFCFSGSRSKQTLFALPDDEDVMIESSKALTLINQDTDKPDNLALLAGGLCKSHMPGEPVIDHLSFAIDKGECFGLLGVNGAGKTTTFGMLTAETRPDKGRLWLNQIYSDISLNLYRSQISYDPQANPDVAITPTEALVLMAELRRIKDEAISKLVRDLLEVLEMSEHANKSMKKLSGGTKRKLTLAMSLIGNSSLLALDEPTAGVDPMARRKIWLLLKTLRTKNNASIIISSHAMEECEAICDRISIMARGKLRCLGSFLHLQSKYALGCVVKITFSGNNPDVDEMKKIVEDLRKRLELGFQSAVKLDDSNDTSAIFSIDCNLKRSKLLKMMRDFCDKYKQIHYIINDTSLEDVFKKIANENSNGCS